MKVSRRDLGLGVAASAAASLLPNSAFSRGRPVRLNVESFPPDEFDFVRFAHSVARNAPSVTAAILLASHSGCLTVVWAKGEPTALTVYGYRPRPAEERHASAAASFLANSASAAPEMTHQYVTEKRIVGSLAHHISLYSSRTTSNILFLSDFSGRLVVVWAEGKPIEVAVFGCPDHLRARPKVRDVLRA